MPCSRSIATMPTRSPPFPPVSISIQPDLGTIYCVAVPVRRVKPGARLGRGGGGVGRDGGGAEWDPEDRDSDPSGRFPMGC